jgi:hypothetical protein
MASKELILSSVRHELSDAATAEAIDGEQKIGKPPPC